MRRPAVVLLAAVLLGGCAATSPDVANTTVCRSVLAQRDTLFGQLGARPQDAAALGATLQRLEGLLQVRDSDASDQMRGDALVLQLNLRAARADLADAGSTPAARLRQAMATFRSRECT